MCVALKEFGGEEMAIFVDMFNKMFDCLNVRNYSEGRKARNDFLTPYTKQDDFRLKVYVRSF